MSLQEPNNKMSKSDSKDSYVSLFDEPQTIKEKVMKAKTDPGKKIKYDQEKKPGISNLITIYSLFSEKKISEVEQEFEQGYQDFKQALVDLLIEKLKPFRQKKKELNKAQVKKILDQGAQQAQQQAKETMKEIKEKMGLLR